MCSVCLSVCTCVSHLRESLGWWQACAELIRVSETHVSVCTCVCVHACVYVQAHGLAASSRRAHEKSMSTWHLMCLLCVCTLIWPYVCLSVWIRCDLVSGIVLSSCRAQKCKAIGLFVRVCVT